MKITGIFIMAAAITNVMAYPSIQCPEWMSRDAFANDLGLIAEVASWDAGYERIHGIRTMYELIAEAEGIYDTRMRVYESSGEIIMTYRPTQQTPAGGDIHNDRRLVPCIFFEGCEGHVDDRFQAAFIDLLNKLPADLLSTNKTIHMASHSLGGALQLYMAVLLAYKYDRRPATILGLAGPFIGDDIFTSVYLKSLRSERWWQVETINRLNPTEYDGTVESYNVDGDPRIMILMDAVCGLTIDKLPDSYGMHDLRNYRLGLAGNE